MTRYDNSTLSCQEALGALKHLQGKVQMVDLPAGRFCQLVATDRKEPTRGSTFTMFKQPGVDRGWVLTCNLDTRDETAKRGCDAAIRGWKFK